MDRPSNGHRRHDAGSVTVVDLIRRQQGPVRIPSADEADTVQFVNDLLGLPLETGTDTGALDPAAPGTSHARGTHRPQDDPPERRGWLARSGKLIGLAFGSLVLCGSVYAASTFAQNDPGADTQRQDAAVLTGVGALLPSAVAAQLSQGATPAAAPPAVSTTHPPLTGKATGSIAGAAPATAQDKGVSRAGSATVPDHSSVSPTQGLLSPADVVRSFFQLAGTDPNQATRLLSPALLHGQEHSFALAWHGMSGLRIDSITPKSEHTVQAVFRIPQPDGAWLRVVELLHVTAGDTPLIDAAQLLSVQHG